MRLRGRNLGVLVVVALGACLCACAGTTNARHAAAEDSATTTSSAGEVNSRHGHGIHRWQEAIDEPLEVQFVFDSGVLPQSGWLVRVPRQRADGTLKYRERNFANAEFVTVPVQMVDDNAPYDGVMVGSFNRHGDDLSVCFSSGYGEYRELGGDTFEVGMAYHDCVEMVPR
jgi:hypothetical protein